MSVDKKVCDDGGSYGRVGDNAGTSSRQDEPRVRLQSIDAVNFGH